MFEVKTDCRYNVDYDYEALCWDAIMDDVYVPEWFKLTQFVWHRQYVLRSG